ncbi:MAG TPA: hypothetical protein ENG16_00245 [Archaeoglobus sp.]|nr:hypothetical protein [Archaeoglobus sp.]
MKVPFKALLLSVLVLLVTGALAAPINPNDWKHPEAMATLDELKKAIGNPDYVIIDASKHKPSKTVKGAIWISCASVRQASGLLKGIKGYPSDPAKDFDPSELQKIFRQLGVSNGKTVIVISRKPVWDAGVVWTSLYFLGYDKVKLLPVNYTAIGEEYLGPVEKSWSPDLPETGDFTVDKSKIRYDMYATREKILGAIESGNVGIMDCRPEAWYKGEIAKSVRGGHLKGAKDVPAESFWEDSYQKELKSKSEIEKLIEEKFPGVKKILTTCNTGHRATVGYFVWQLGYEWLYDDASWNIHAYDASMPAEDIHVLISYKDYSSLKKTVQELKEQISSLQKELAKEKASKKTTTPSKKTPGFELVIAIIGIAAVAYIVRRK